MGIDFQAQGSVSTLGVPSRRYGRAVTLQGDPQEDLNSHPSRPAFERSRCSRQRLPDGGVGSLGHSLGHRVSPLRVQTRSSCWLPNKQSSLPWTRPICHQAHHAHSTRHEGGGLRRPHASSQRRHFSSGEETRSKGGGAGGCSSRETLRGEDGAELSPAWPGRGRRCHCPGTTLGSVLCPSAHLPGYAPRGGRRKESKRAEREEASPVT